MALLVGCAKEDGNGDFGLAYIYMPQAATSGNDDGRYEVPSGKEMTYNFNVKDGKLNVFLGVVRSGKLSSEGFSVDVKVLTDTTNQIIASGDIEDAMLLPATIYSLPNKVSVSDGYWATFYLLVDTTAIKNDAYTGKNLVLVVGIANPDKFELSNKNICTVVIIDVDAIRKLL